MVLTGFLSWILSVIYKSFFLTGDEGFRRAHVLAKATFILSIILLILKNPARSYLLALFIIPIGLIYPGFEWVVAVTTLTALVGFAMGASAYLLSLTGLYHMTPLELLLIMARSIGLGMGLVFMFVIISPIELFNLLYLLGFRSAAVVPLLLAKTTPLGVRSFLDSLMVGSLKHEAFTKRIPPAVASLIEVGRFIDEYCYWKLRIPARKMIAINRSYNYTVILLIISLLLAILQAKLWF